MDPDRNMPGKIAVTGKITGNRKNSGETRKKLGRKFRVREPGKIASYGIGKLLGIHKFDI